MGIRGVLFDLDNTLVDRDASLFAFTTEWLDVFSEFLADVDDERVLEVVREADGGGYGSKEAFFTRLIADLPWRQAPGPDEMRAFWYTVFPRCTQPASGLYNMLETLGERGFKIGIVTNGTERSQQGKVDRLGLRDYVELVVISETVGVKKPDPEIFETARAGLDLPVGDLCFVGDHPINDVDGARRMGMTPVWMAGHHVWPEDLEPPLWQVESLIELAPLLERIYGEQPTQ